MPNFSPTKRRTRRRGQTGHQMQAIAQAALAGWRQARAEAEL